MLGGLGAFLGHLFPLWLGFNGGKGVATYIGVLLGLYWPLGIVFCALWLAVALATPLLLPLRARGQRERALLFALLGEWGLAALFLLLTLLLFWRHAANIARLLSGEEGRIGKTAR